MSAPAPRAEKQTVVDLARYLEKGVQVKLSGGRQGMMMNMISIIQEDVDHVLHK